MTTSGTIAGLVGRRVCWPERGRAVVGEFLPQAPGPGELLIEPERTLSSPGRERAFFLGLPNAVDRFPAYRGYCSVGCVLAVGEGGEGGAVGDRAASSGGHASHARVRVG